MLGEAPMQRPHRSKGDTKAKPDNSIRVIVPV